MAEFENFGFYTIDADYLEYLNNKNSEVYYNASYRYAIKPFVGIIIDMTECKYFILVLCQDLVQVKMRFSSS